MSQLPSRSVLAAVGVAALLVTTGCLSAVGGSGATTDTVTATDESTETPTADEQSATDSSSTDEQARTETPTATAAPTTTSAGPPSADELEAAFESRVSSMESYTATRSQTTTLDNRSVSQTTEIWFRLSTGEYRQEVVSPEARAGNVAVAGTDTVWTYDEAANEVTKLDRSQAGGTNVSSSLVRQLATRYDVTDVATASVDGQETYRVDLVPESDSTVNASVTAWLTQETYFPVRIDQTYALENRTFTTETRFEDVTLNATIPDDRFTFDVPENATVETVDLPETETFDSRDAMRDAANASVPDPAVPEGYAFDQGRIVRSNQTNSTTLTLQYSNETATLSVSKVDRTFSSGEGENVTVGEREGRLRTYGETTMISWQCDGWTYSVSGHLDRAELLDVARSVECE